MGHVASMVGKKGVMGSDGETWRKVSNWKI